MAIIAPDLPPGTCTAEALKLHRLLKRLPDEQYRAWHRLAIHDDPGPDFWVLSHDQRALLLKVSTAAPSDVRSALQSNLFQSTAPAGAAEADALRRFIGVLAEKARGEAEVLRRIPTVIVFPNVAQVDLDRVLHADVVWVGKDVLHPDHFEEWLERQLGPTLSPDAERALRRAFTPEVVIPSSFTVRQPIERSTDARLTGHLLDYSQEWVLKTDLDLSGEAWEAAGDFGLRLVNGVAGSGKSLIVVYRAHLLKRLFPAKRILVLTHNKALIHDLQSRYRRLGGNSAGIEWKTFQSWAWEQWPPSERQTKAISIGERETLVEQVWGAQLADTSISARMLRDEIDWYKDRLLFGRDDYLNADRSGRGFALNEAMRQRVFDALQAYQRKLQHRKVIDWGDVARRVWRWTSTGRLRLPVYDCVLVDEAQFFAPLWFELIKKIVKPRTGHLFLAADPTQGFLKRRQSWIASGLEVRGHSHRLAKSYRTTHEILDFAMLLYRARLPEDDDDIVAPEFFDMPKGTVPEIVPLTSEQDEITRVVNEVKRLVQSGVPPGHILIIHADWQGKDRLIQRLQRELGTSAAADPAEKLPGSYVRVSTLNAATGLESPIVFLSGAHALYEEEQSVRLSDEERAELIRDNTRKLYMAVTRAGQRLVMTHVGNVPDWLSQLMPVRG